MGNEKNLILRFFSNPIVGILGSFASILGILLSIYLYNQSKQYRELVFCVHPVKTTVANTKQLSSLKIFKDNKQITGEVTAVQIGLWNQGTQSIKHRDVLDPIQIITKPPVPILEAKIRNESRKVINISLDESKLDSGTLGGQMGSSLLLTHER